MVQLQGTAVTVLGPGPEDLQLMGYNLMAPERRRVVLESAVRTGKIAFADPPVEDLATEPTGPTSATGPTEATGLSGLTGPTDVTVAEVPPTESPLADMALGGVSLDQPSIALDLDVNRSEHG